MEIDQEIRVIKEGDLVIVYPLSKDNLVIGTFIGIVKDNQVQVLLPNGFIFTGVMRDIKLFV